MSPEGTAKTVDTVETRTTGAPTREKGFSDYLRPLSRHVLLIGLLVLLAIAVGILTWALTFGSSSYEGQAVVLFKPNGNSQANLSGNPQFSDITLDTNRQQSAILLMGSMDIVKDVQKEAAANSNSAIAALASEDPLALRDSVHVQSQGNFISVQGEASTPAVAAWLANAWANAGVAKVNATYAQPSANVDEAIQQAKSQLDSDQTALEDFIAHSSILTLTAQLSQTTGFINSAVVSSAESDFVLYNSAQQSVVQQISSNYTITVSLNQQLNQLQALRTRIEQAPEDQASLYANQVSLVLLLNNVTTGVMGTDAGSGVQLQLSLADVGTGPLSKANQLSEIDAAIKSIQGLQEDISGQTADLEKRLVSASSVMTPGQSSALSPATIAYIARQNQLRSQLEQQNAQLTQLQKTRDLDQDTYDLLRSRLAEQNVNGIIGDVVAVGSPADEEQTARSRSAIRALAASVGLWVVVALVLGIVLAFLLGLMRPDFDSNATISRRLRISRGGAKRVRVSPSEPQ